MLTLMAHLNSSADAAAWKNRCHVENQEKKTQLHRRECDSRREKKQNNDHNEKKQSSEILSFSPVSEEDSAHFPCDMKQSKPSPTPQK